MKWKVRNIFFLKLVVFSAEAIKGCIACLWRTLENKSVLRGLLSNYQQFFGSQKLADTLCGTVKTSKQKRGVLTQNIMKSNISPQEITRWQNSSKKEIFNLTIESPFNWLCSFFSDADRSQVAPKVPGLEGIWNMTAALWIGGGGPCRHQLHWHLFHCSQYQDRSR